MSLPRLMLHIKQNLMRIAIPFFLFSLFSGVSAQCPFTIGHGDDIDTVCVNDTVFILNYSGGPCGDSLQGDIHEWNYQSASMLYASKLDTLTVTRQAGFSFPALAKDSGHYFAFITQNTPSPLIRRYSFDDSLQNLHPHDSVIINLQDYTNLVNGISIQFDTLTKKWYAILTSGTTYLDEDTTKDKSKLLRLTFDSGLYHNPTRIENLGSFGSMFRKPGKIVLVNGRGKWYGFVANTSGLPVISRITFTQGLGGDSASVLVDNYTLDKTLTNNSSRGITSLSVVQSKEGWHVFCVNMDNNYLIRVDFDSTFSSYTATKVNDPDKNIKNPRDINVVNDCHSYTGMVINGGDNTYSMVYFPTGLSGGIRTGKSPKNNLMMNNLVALSDVFRAQGSIYGFLVNNNGPVARLRFLEDTVSHTIPAKPATDRFAPALFAYKDTGLYTITLTVNGDYSKTTCRTVYVMKPPARPIIDSVRYYCEGDTIAISNFAAFRGRPQYYWTFPDSSVRITRYPVIHDTGYYSVYVAYDLCKSKTDRDSLTPHKAPPSLSGYVQSVCPGLTSQITVTNVIPGDSIFAAYASDTSFFFKGKTTSFSYKFLTPPSDTTEGVYHYLVMRKPPDAGNCPKDTSEPYDIWFAVQRPVPPVVSAQQTICKPDDGVAVKALTGINIKWYADASLKKPLITGYSDIYIPTPAELANEYNYFYATQFSGGCESHASAPAVVRVYVPGPPAVNNINGCVNQYFPDYFYATGVPGATFSWYSDSTLSVSSFLGNGNTLLHHMEQGKPGTMSVWVTQTINASSGTCTSQPRKATIRIGKTDPPIPVMTDPEYFTCIGDPINVMRVQPVAGYEKIHWYLNDTGSAVVSTKEYYQPNVPNTIKKDYRYFIRQYKDGCWSKDTTIVLHVLSCILTDTVVCNNTGQFDLYKAVPWYTERIYHWQDIDYTGQLNGSIVMLNGLENKTVRFQNKNQKVSLTVDKFMEAGKTLDGKDSVPACNDTIDLFSLIEQYDEGGRWAQNGKYLASSLIAVPPAKNNYVYRISSLYKACPDDSVRFVLYADTTLILNCDAIEQKNIYLDEGEELYSIHDNSFDPVVEGTPCMNYILTNSLNGKNTLEGTTLTTGPHFITWTAKNKFTHTPYSCLSNLVVSPIKIMNMFTPNGDGVNDFWDIDLRKYPEAVVKVYNRWGILVYEAKAAESADHRIVWDGMIQGKNRPAPPDGYFYLIYNDDKVIYKGSVTLVR